MTPAEVRALFPALRRYTWLNAAASSPTAQPVLDAIEAHLRETVEKGDLGFSKWLSFREAVRARAARLIGAEPRELAFTPSTSFGFNVVAELLKARGITEVLTLDHEFPSTTLPLLGHGLTLRGARRRTDGTWALDDLAAALRPTTGAVAVSVVQYASGFRVDLPGLAQLCRDRGLALCVNAAQALGQVPLDVKALGVACLAATSHKWLMAGYGTGLLYVDGAWLDETPLPLGGWLSVEAADLWQPFARAQRTDDETGFTARGTQFRKEASALETGASSMTGAFALDAALAIHEAVGVENTLTHNLGLQRQLREGLRRRGFAPNTPDEPRFGSGICVVPVAGNADDAVRALVREADVVTTARGGGLRVSTHVYNDADDVERLLRALDRLGVRPADAPAGC